MTKANPAPAPAPENTPAPAHANPTPAAEESESEFRVLVMIPTANPDVFETRIFLNRTAVKKLMKEARLPEGTRFFRGKELHAKVETVTVISL